MRTHSCGGWPATGTSASLTTASTMFNHSSVDHPRCDPIDDQPAVPISWSPADEANLLSMVARYLPVSPRESRPTADHAKRFRWSPALPSVASPAGGTDLRALTLTPTRTPRHRTNPTVPNGPHTTATRTRSIPTSRAGYTADGRPKTATTFNPAASYTPANDRHHDPIRKADPLTTTRPPRRGRNTQHRHRS
jgi:hypothetical protein